MGPTLGFFRFPLALSGWVLGGRGATLLEDITRNVFFFFFSGFLNSKCRAASIFLMIFKPNKYYVALP